MVKLTINQVLQQGVDAHKAGQVQEAHRLYAAILKVQPKHPDANHNTGLLAVGDGKIELALPFFKTALEANPSIAQFWYSHIVALIKLERLLDAKVLLDQAKSKGIKGANLDQLEQRLNDANKGQTKSNNSGSDEHGDQSKILGTLNLDQALRLAKKKANEGYPEEAKRIYQNILEKFPGNKKALAFKPDYADAYYKMGIALQVQGKLEEAIEAYNKALAIKPDYAGAYYNMGIALQVQGKLEEAIEAYKKALSIKPDYAIAYNNMGNALKDQGKLEEAIEAYNKALSIKPDYAEAHRHLSTLIKYTLNDPQISVVDDLLQREKLNDSDRLHLHYTYAKMQEDLGDLSVAFDSYVTGGDLRQRSLAYEFSQDEHKFGRIKQTAPQFKEVALNVTGEPIRYTPIFILGMPRSGTTLVEQIVSSHSEITGAGELAYVSQFGDQLATGLTASTIEAVSVFRDRYLAELAKRANGQAFITDKMPQNFQYIALICAAFPEAKIVHVQRSAEATCWSNFKHYFVSKGLGYSYNLSDTVRYYGLYTEIMHFWGQSYSDRIYNLDYDKLTEDQELETRSLIEYLELNWQDTCLTPQKNKRSVKTASQQQVRQKVYKGSSQAWRKYESCLNGVFDGLKGIVKQT